MTASPLRAYLVDDEPLALKRLARLLDGRSDVEVVGSSTDAEAAVRFLRSERVDVLFLDVEMPVLNGFELLARLDRQPWVVFTTAYDGYALRAFAVNSIDYLLKPVERPQLDRALTKLEALRSANAGDVPDWLARGDVEGVLTALAASLGARGQAFAERIPSRVGDRVQILSLRQVTHFVAEKKLTYAVADGRQHVVDESLTGLERILDPSRFARIHRAVIVNLDWVHELRGFFAGGLVVRLKDEAGTQLTVARDRVAFLKRQLGLRPANLGF